jgi:hypothetical protein
MFFTSLRKPVAIHIAKCHDIDIQVRTERCKIRSPHPADPDACQPQASAPCMGAQSTLSTYHGGDSSGRSMQHERATAYRAIFHV